jgi:hypothetical protein
VCGRPVLPDARIVIVRAAAWQCPQAYHHRCASSPGLWVFSVAHPVLLLIYSFIFFFVVVSRIGHKSTTKCNGIVGTP